MARFFIESGVLLHRHSGRLLEVTSDCNPRRMAIASKPLALQNPWAMKYRIRLNGKISSKLPSRVKFYLLLTTYHLETVS